MTFCWGEHFAHQAPRDDVLLVDSFTQHCHGIFISACGAFTGHGACATQVLIVAWRLRASLRLNGTLAAFLLAGAISLKRSETGSGVRGLRARDGSGSSPRWSGWRPGTTLRRGFLLFECIR